MSRRPRHNCLSLSLCLTLGLMLALPGTGCRPRISGEPVRIGFIGSLSGKYATMGVTARDGTIQALEEINGAGGVCGRRIELVIRDDGGDPEVSVHMAREIASLGISILIGPLTSACGWEILPLINERKILTISPTTTSVALADREDFFIKFSPNANQYGAMIGSDIGGASGAPVVAVEDTRNPAFCDSFLEGLEDTLRIGEGRALETVPFDSSSLESSVELAERILSFTPEAVVFCASSLDTAVLSQRLRKGSPQIRLYSSEWAISPSLVENGADGVEGLTFYSVMNFSDTSGRFLAFKRAYRERFSSEPTLAALNYYETVGVLAEALGTDCSVSQPEDLIKTIVNRERFQGIQRDFRFDAQGDAVLPLMKHVVRNGSFLKVPSVPEP